MTRTLVIAPQWIGDAVMSEPLLARLAGRGERLTVAALPWVAPVYRAMPQVADVLEMALGHGRLEWRSRWRIAAELRRRRFGVTYVLPNSIKSALIPWLARIPIRVGYHGESRYGLLNRRAPNPIGRPPMVEHYLALARAGVAAAGISVHDQAAASARPHLQADAVRADALSTGLGLPRGAFWAFAPGAEYGPAKRWPAERYASLAQALHAADGTPIVLLGSALERALCDEIATLAPGSCRVLAGSVGLDDAIVLIAMARGLVSNDSGLMHVAAAFGVPQVGVFGSTSPLHTPPLNRNARVLWLKDELQLDCAPCFDRRCRFGHTRCLTGVPVERVEAALLDALAGVDPAAATA